MTKQPNAMLQLITESMMRSIVAILLIFGSVQWFSESSYNLMGSKVYANNTDHQLDPGFDSNNQIRSIHSNINIRIIRKQQDNKILIGGRFSSVGGQTRNSIARLNADGSLDTSFANPNINSEVQSIEVQQDGKILIGGNFTSVGGQIRNSLARLNADGSLDTSFSNFYTSGSIYKIEIQPNGKILVGGNFTSVGGQTINSIARLNADGSLDTSFSNSYTSGFISEIAFQPDGKILVGGNFTSVGGQTRNRIARLNADGSLDTSFADLNLNSSVYLIEIQSDNKIMIGGYFNSVGGETRKYLARLNADGSLDTSFADLNPSSYIRSIAIQSDGKILVGGIFTSVGGQTRNRLARLNADGSLDTSFADPNINSDVRSIGIQSDGKILVGGIFTTVNNQTKNRLARFNADGSLDTSYTSTNIEDTGYIFEITVQQDGKILIGGNFTSVGGQTRNSLARLNADGSLDTTFADLNINTSGTLLTGYNSHISNIQSIVIQSDGKILVGGYFTTVDGQTRNRLARLNADGSLDTTFIDPNIDNSIRTIAIQQDGKILIGGNFDSVGGETRREVARLNPDGSLDTTFPDLNVINRVTSIVIQPDEKILVGGSFYYIGGYNRKNITRLNSNGSLDSSFVNLSINGEIHSVLLQSNGKILIGGNFTTIDGHSRNRLARLNADGSLDTSFTGPNINSRVNSIAMQSDGKMLIGGNFDSVGGETRREVARLNPDGSLDTSFPDLNLNISTTYSNRSIVIDQYGKILIGENFYSIGGQRREGIARLLGSGGGSNPPPPPPPTFSCSNVTAIPQSQCQALVDIYNQMGGTSRNPVYTQGAGNTNLGGPSSGWLMNNDPCSWHGVTCDTSSPRNVIGLNFAGGKYNQCRASSLYKAGITGSFPLSFSNLNQLQTFEIGYNAGINQSSLQSLTMPTTLRYYCAENIGLTTLSPNQFTGLNQLNTLSLNNNNLTSLNPNQFYGLSNLYRLYLYQNQISFLSPTQFTGLNQLNTLYLNNNNLTSLASTQFQGLSNLQSLILYQNNLTGFASNQFQGLNQLRELYLSNNNITLLTSNQFQGLTDLRTLSLFDNNISGLASNQFQGLNQLEELYLNSNNITALHSNQFSGLSNLRSLYFSNLKKTSPYFTGAIPATYSGINFTTNPSSPKYLYVRDVSTSNPNTICGQTPTWITNAWNQHFSGNRNNTDLDDLSRFGGTGQTVNLCPSGASCNTTADCTSGLTCSENGNPSGIFTCQGTGTNQSPTVTLTIPDNIAPHTAPATISMEATATDTDGTINQVQFMSGATVLATDMSSPYAYTRTGVGVGTYSITAIATDNSGSTAISNAVSVTVLASGTTTYTLTGTLGMTGANASVNVCGTAVTANSSGIFSRSMIASGTNCGGITATKTGHTCTITTQGPNPLTGNVNNVVGTCTPTTGNQSPTVSLTSPTNNATFTAPASIILSANATDPDGTIQSVQFRNGSTTLNTDSSSPYAYNWTNVPAGTYTLTAIATDNSGAMTTSTPITITVQSSGGGGGGGGGSNNTCSAGSYRNGSACTSCSAGSYCPGGVNGTATTCPANHYCPAGASTPTACPNGTTSPSGSRTLSHCINPNSPDTDGDGIPDTQEQSTPNSGDANFDGIADASQTTVRTLQTPTNGIQATIALTGLSTCTGTIITQLQTENQVANDSLYAYPYGLNRIIVPCNQATVRVFYHGASNLPSSNYRKYLNSAYQNFPVTFGTQNGVRYLQFMLVDGGAGDSDGTANGTITDPGGIAVYQSSGGGGGGGGGGGRSSSVYCGNNRLDAGEQCDDGNIRNGDGCSSRCYNESGTSSSGGNTNPTTPKATMIKMLQETLDTLEKACEHADDDRTQKIKNMRDMSREDRFDPEATLTNYCITKGYKNKRQKNAAMGIGEAIKIVTKIATINDGIRFREGEKPDRALPYKDIKHNARYATYVNAAYDKGILDGLTDSHRNKKELKAFTPISASQLLLLLENAGGAELSVSQSDEDQALNDILGLILPAKQNLSPLKGKTISRAQAAKYIVNAFPEYFENYEYLVGNNAVYLGNILAGISKKNEAEQRSYIIDKINTLKNVNEATYGEKYKIDTEVIITFLEKVVN